MAEYQITAIRMSGGPYTGHEHIAEVQLSNSIIYTVDRIIGFIRAGHTFIVSDGPLTVLVGDVPASPEHRAYIRTYADGVWTDNLLALPRF